MRSRRTLGLSRSGWIQLLNRLSGTRRLGRAPKGRGVVADHCDVAQVQFGEELGDHGGERREGEGEGVGVHVDPEQRVGQKERDPVRSGVPLPRYFGCIRLSPTSRTDRHSHDRRVGR